MFMLGSMRNPVWGVNGESAYHYRQQLLTILIMPQMPRTHRLSQTYSLHQEPPPSRPSPSPMSLAHMNLLPATR